MSSSDAIGRVFVVDDEPAIVEIIRGVLEMLDCVVESCATKEEALRWMALGKRAVILLDVNLPDGNGLEMVEEFQSSNPNNPIILMTGEVALEAVVTATLAGAFDFISKADPAQFQNRVLISTRNALASMALEAQPAPSQAIGGDAPRRTRIIAGSSNMKEVLADIEKLGSSKVSVLIQGASGTGKEVVAHAIHETGRRGSGPFVAVNCAGIPDTLLESELFGYERGAFTGAVARRIGRFEAAHQGTIFLDEIGEMSLPLQAKLLRVVQDGRFERLGGTQTVEVDVRVLSATNRNLTEMVAEGTFREDLYYRIAVFTLTLPALADRKVDIAPLVHHFLRAASVEEGKDEPQISSEVMQLLETHPWPGNVRQLQNVIKHAVVVGDGRWVTINDLPGSFTRQLPESLDVRPRSKPDLHMLPPMPEGASVSSRLDAALAYAFPNAQVLPNMDDLEGSAIRLVMKRLEGNRKKSAQVLGMSRATLYRRLDGELRGGKRRGPPAS